MLMPFAKVMRCWGVLLFVGLSGCSPMQPKPVIVDTQAQVEAALPLKLEQQFTEALALLRDKEFKQAEQLLLVITTKYPAYAGPWSNLAIAQLSLQQFDASLLSIDKALSVDGKFCPSLSLKGVVLRELGRFAEAKTVYLHAIECDPSDVMSLYNLGVLSDLYLHDEVSALFYYQSYLVAQSEGEDTTVESWVIALKRRVPEEQRIALVVKKSEAAEEKLLLLVRDESEIADVPTVKSSNVNPVDVNNEGNEPQLAGEE